MTVARSEESVPAARRNTALYFTVSSAVAALGFAATLWATLMDGKPFDFPAVLFALGTSICAGGLASLALGILRWMDDRDSTSLGGAVQALASGAAKSEAAIIKSVTELQAEIARKVILDTSSRFRCVDDARIGEAFQTAYTFASIRNGSGAIRVDVVGLKLLRFLDDQLAFLQTSGHRVNVRLLLQSPDEEIFADICKMEGRDVRSTAKDIRSTLGLLSGAAAIGKSLIWRRNSLTIELRFYSDYQPITLFRVADECYVRPRVSTPKGASSRFYERYDATLMKPHFEVFNAHFEKCWNDGSYTPLYLDSGDPDGAVKD